MILEVINHVRKVIETTDLRSLTQTLGREHSFLTKDELKFGGRLRQKKKLKRGVG